MPRPITAAAWSACEFALRHVVQLVVAVFLARLLNPADFGIAALIMFFTGLAGVFVEGGLGGALIQKRDLSQVDICTVFFTQIGMSLVCSSALVVAAPWISSLYGYPVLENLTILMAANLILGAFGGVQSSLIARSLDYRPQMIAATFASIVSGVLAVGLAYRGAGVWALGAQMLANTCVTGGMLWWLHPWRPEMLMSLRSLREMFSFSRYILAATIMNVLDSSLYTVVIGKLHGPFELGQYNRAVGIQQLPAILISSVLSRIVFPMFSAAQDDLARVKSALRRSVVYSMTINAPAMLGLAAFAEPFVNGVFGEQWRPAVPLLQILCCAGAFRPLHTISSNALLGIGRSDLVFRLEFFKKALALALLAASAPFGLVALAWSQVIASIGALGVNALYTATYLDYGLSAQARDAAPAMLASILMAGLITALLPLASSPILVVLLAAVALTFYCGVWFASDPAPAHDFLKQLRMSER